MRCRSTPRTQRRTSSETVTTAVTVVTTTGAKKVARDGVEPEHGTTPFGEGRVEGRRGTRFGIGSRLVDAMLMDLGR